MSEEDIPTVEVDIPTFEADIPIIEAAPVDGINSAGGRQGVKEISKRGLNGRNNLARWAAEKKPLELRAPKISGKQRRENDRKVTRTIGLELERVVIFHGLERKKRHVLAALLSDALLKGRVDFMDGRTITLNSKTWSDLMIRVVEHLDGKVDPKVEINNNIMAAPNVVTDSDLDALARIYARNITPQVEEDETE